MSDEIDYKYHFEDVKRRYQESQRMLEVRTKQLDSARFGYRMIAAMVLPSIALNIIFGVFAVSLFVESIPFIVPFIVPVVACALLSSFITYLYVVDSQTTQRKNIVQERNEYYRKMLFLERQIGKIRGE